MKQGWEIKRLEELAIKLFAGGDKPKVFSEHPTGTLNIPVYANGVSLNGLVGYTDKAIVDRESITISARGTIGYCCVRKTPFVPIVRLITIIPTENIKTEFLYYALSNATIENNGVAIPQLTIPMIKGISIPVPPIEEQERIVAELDCLSGVIERKREQLRELDALAQSIFYQMFGDPNTNDRNWNVVKLNTTCDNLDYQRRPITAKDRIDGDIPYYGASGVVDYVQDYIFDGDYLLVSEDGANLEVRHTPIAFSIKGKTWVNNHAHILKFEHYCTQVFMEYYINLLDISDIITGCAQPKLTQANLNSINVFDISIEKQQEFADKIEAIERQKELIKKSISETENLFNARMDYYFN